MNDRDDEVRARAFAIWQSAGEVHGADREHWLRAERDLAADAASAGSPGAPAAIDTVSAIPLAETAATHDPAPDAALSAPVSDAGALEPAAAAPRGRAKDATKAPARAGRSSRSRTLADPKTVR